MQRTWYRSLDLTGTATSFSVKYMGFKGLSFPDILYRLCLPHTFWLSSLGKSELWRYGCNGHISFRAICLKISPYDSVSICVIVSVCVSVSHVSLCVSVSPSVSLCVFITVSFSFCIMHGWRSLHLFQSAAGGKFSDDDCIWYWLKGKQTDNWQIFMLKLYMYCFWNKKCPLKQTKLYHVLD